MCLTFLGNYQTVFRSGRKVLHSQKQCVEVLGLPHLLQDLAESVFSILPIPIGMQGLNLHFSKNYQCRAYFYIVFAVHCHSLNKCLSLLPIFKLHSFLFILSTVSFKT